VVIFKSPVFFIADLLYRLLRPRSSGFQLTEQGVEALEAASQA